MVDEPHLTAESCPQKRQHCGRHWGCSCDHQPDFPTQARLGRQRQVGVTYEKSDTCLGPCVTANQPPCSWHRQLGTEFTSGPRTNQAQPSQSCAFPPGGLGAKPATPLLGGVEIRFVATPIFWHLGQHLHYTFLISGLNHYVGSGILVPEKLKKG